MSRETVEIEDVTVKAESTKALLCLIEDKEHWIPKSQIDEDCELAAKGDVGTLIIPQWLAEEKELV